MFFACTTAIYWLNALTYLRMFENTSAFVRMVTEIVKDIRYFLLIFFMGLFAMAMIFFILERGDQNNILDGYPVPSYFNSFMYSFLQAQGEFGQGAYPDSHYTTILWFILILNLMFVNITLLNLLIAIMGDTFDRVKDIEQEAKFREQSNFISDFAFIFPFEKYAKKPYIIYLAVERDEDEDGDDLDGWTGKLSEMRRQFN